MALEQIEALGRAEIQGVEQELAAEKQRVEFHFRSCSRSSANSFLRNLSEKYPTGYIQGEVEMIDRRSPRLSI